MNNLNVIDSFMATFTSTIDSGFGLLSGNVATLTTILVGIDITLAGLFWAMDEGSDIVGRLIKKVLYVGVALLAGGAVAGGARLLGAAGSGGMAAIRAGTSMGSAASSAYQMGQATSGGGIAAGVGGVARATGGAMAQKARAVAGRAGESLSRSAQSGREAAWRATGGSPTSGMSALSSTGPAPSSPPRWAQRLRAEQAARTHRHATAQAIKDGDRPGAAANPDLSTKED